MIRRSMLTVLLLALTVAGSFAQEKSVKAKITDLEKVTVAVERLTTSSSSCGSGSDFPVYQDGQLVEMDFNEVSWLTVRHDLTPSNPNIYISVELEFTNGRSGIYEMIKHIRFSGETADGEFSIKVKNINTIQIIRRP